MPIFKQGLIALLFVCPNILSAQSEALYDDSKVSSIYIQIPQDSLAYMIGNLVNDYYLRAEFVFVDGSTRDTVHDIGLRLRGNTSLSSQKKSFKISFNAFEADREYQGVRKLNLLGSHNDPTMVREKLFYECWGKTGMPDRRASFVKLYINSEYRGLYTNMEEIDKRWLKRHFEDNDGNLYKCTYPADLKYLGGSQQTYKNIMNNPDERAYDLVTNETLDDYTRFVELLYQLTQPADADFAANIQGILNIESVLKAFALDVATGNWDDYFYNKNNFYLYDDPVSGKFQFVTYDTDNTFGVDWLNKDWTTRDALSWQKTGEARPLAKLLEVPEFKAQYVHYLDSITRFITWPDSIFPRIDYVHNLVTPAAVSDIYRTLDYGYTLGDFHNGFTQTVDSHTPYGIKPFLEARATNTLEQIEGLVEAKKANTNSGLRVFPNPTTGEIYLDIPESFDRNLLEVKVCRMDGKLVERTAVPFIQNDYLQLKDLPDGTYWLRISDQQKVSIGKIVLIR